MKLGFKRPGAKPVEPPAPPVHIAFDRVSMIIDGKRTILRGGAFHYYRLPAPGLWRERLLKIQRAGYNTVDLYFPWSYHSPADGMYYFDDARDVDYLLSLCDEMGLFVIARPGPFINSEVDGGGHPAWLLAQADVPLRSLRDGRHVNSLMYCSYVRQWYGQIVPRIIKHPSVILFQIENEYANEGLDPSFMIFLRDLARELGVTQPLIHNDLYKQGCWADLVDIYGVDEYAVTSFGRDWRGDSGTLTSLDNLGAVKDAYCTNSPLAVFELQGGWFDPWNGIGYDELRRRLGAENLQLVTLSSLAHGATIYSHYMFVGGTNWDHIGAPVVYTSYDFAAPVHEWGGISERYHAAKAIAMQLAAFEEMFALSEPCNDVLVGSPSLLYKARRSGDAHIAYLRNFSGQARTTALKVGPAEVAAAAVAPWSMRTVMLNMPFVNAHVTAGCQVLTAMHYENQHLLVFHGPGWVKWTLPTPCRVLSDELGATLVDTSVAMTYDGVGWKDVVFSSGGHRYRALFVPGPDQVWLNGDFLVLGASFVGEGRMKGGVTDLPRYEMRVQTPGPEEHTIRVYSVHPMNRVEINDEMAFASSETVAGYFRFEMPRPPEVTLPALGPWRVRSAVESPTVEPWGGWRQVASEDSLEMDRLGAYKGFVWYRATYKGVMLSIALAIRHNAAVYVNGRFVTKLDNYQSESNDTAPESLEVKPALIQLPARFQTDGENSVTILVESLGHNKGFLANERFPRGILEKQSDRPLAWSYCPGIAAELDVPRPAYDDERWTPVADLSTSLDDDVVWARTRFTLDLPPHVYAPIGLRFEGVADKAHVYLNGVLVARDWSIGPQRVFYLPEGVLNTHGDNVLVLLLWRRGAKPAAGTVELVTYTVEANNFVNIL